MKRAHIGIDIGKKGAIVVLVDDGSIEKFLIPLINDEIDLTALNSLLRDLKNKYNVIVLMENLNAIFGSSAGATFDFGFTAGCIEALLIANGISYMKIQAKTWQKVLFEGIPKMLNSKGKNDTKGRSIMASKRIYPNVDLRRTERSKIDDHNVSDALLIATYCKNNYK